VDRRPRAQASCSEPRGCQPKTPEVPLNPGITNTRRAHYSKQLKLFHLVMINSTLARLASSLLPMAGETEEH
jgi:hypothetical protein